MSIGEITPVLYNNLGELKKRIDAYDLAASPEKSLRDKWSSSFAKWGFMSSLGYMGDSYLRLKKPVSDSKISLMEKYLNDLDMDKLNQQQLINKPNNVLMNKLNSYNQNTLTYKKLLGIGESKIIIGAKGNFENYKSFFNREGFEAYKNAVRSNFNFKENINPDMLKGMTVKSYFKHTLLGEKVNSLVHPFSKGELCSTALRSLGLGLLAWGIYSKTRDSYLASKSDKDNWFTTIGKTAFAFITQATKSLICWELGTIGFALGSAILCVGIWPAMLAGIATGALFGTVGYKLLSKIIPDPPYKAKYTQQKTESPFLAPIVGERTTIDQLYKTSLLE